MALKKTGKIYIGTSGFSYQHWGNGLFYPQKLPFSQWLNYYSSYFNSVELNVTFNKLPHKDFFIQWEKETSRDFKFSVKGNQYITHLKKLTAISEPLKLFMERISKLKDKLAAIVWEIPPLGTPTFSKLERFIIHLKKYTQAKHFFNFEQSKQKKELYQLIIENQMFIVEKEKFQKSVISKNTELRYLRLENPNHSSKIATYSQTFLEKLRDEIKKKWLNQTDIFIYFANDVEGYAIENAKKLLKLCQSFTSTSR